MKRILIGISVVLIVGIVGSALGFGTSLGLTFNPYYRAAKRIEANVDNVDVLSIEQRKSGYLEMTLVASGEVPGLRNAAEKELRELVNDDTRIVMIVIIYYFRGGLTMGGETSEYWCDAVIGVSPESLLFGDATWIMQYPFNYGIIIPLTQEDIDDMRAW